MLLGRRGVAGRSWRVVSRSRGVVVKVVRRPLALAGAVLALLLLLTSVSTATSAPRVTLTGVAGAGAPIGHGPSPALLNVTTAVAFSPNGRLLVAANDLVHQLSVFRVASDGRLTRVVEARRSSTIDGSLSALAFSPGGRLLAVAGSGGELVGSKAGALSLFAVSSGGTLRRTAVVRVGRGPRGVSFSPNGRLLATIRPDGESSQVVVFDVARDGRLTEVANSKVDSRAPNGPSAVAFGHGGALLAVLDVSSGGLLVAPGEVAVFRVTADGELTPVAESGDDSVGAPAPGGLAFSPSGRLLATSVTGLRVSGGGELSAPSVVRVFDVASDGKATRTVNTLRDAGFRGAAATVSFSPDGQLLAAAGSEISVFAVGPEGGLRPVTRARVRGVPVGGAEIGGVGSVAFSPDGKLLVVAAYRSGTPAKPGVFCSVSVFRVDR